MKIKITKLVISYVAIMGSLASAHASDGKPFEAPYTDEKIRAGSLDAAIDDIVYEYRVVLSKRATPQEHAACRIQQYMNSHDQMVDKMTEFLKAPTNAALLVLQL
jgi:hypothetical protein